MVFSVLTELFPSIITLFFTLGYIFYLNWKLSLFVLLLIPVIGGVIAFFSKKIREKAESIQDKLVSNHSILHEVFINYPAIKIFYLESKKNDEFNNLENHNNKDNLDIVKLIALQPSVIGVIQVIGICIIACFGGYQLFNKTLTLAELLSFGTALSLTIEPVIFITKSLGIINKSLVSIDNSINLKNYLKDNLDKKNRLIKSIKDYTISFENISFSYNKEEKVFENVNLTINHGKIIAFCGDNGCGKSTLVKLFLQLLDNFSGEIKLGKYNISDYDLEIFRTNIKACFSEPFIFNGTIKDNILLGNDIYFNELEKVIQITKIDEIISNLKEGYDYYINNSGNNLSSGQKQRIALARAIISKPEILVLDEATSNLDLEAEKYIYKAIREYLPNSTIIIINHRKQSISFVDEIFKIEKLFYYPSKLNFY